MVTNTAADNGMILDIYKASYRNKQCSVMMKTQMIFAIISMLFTVKSFLVLLRRSKSFLKFWPS